MMRRSLWTGRSQPAASEKWGRPPGENAEEEVPLAVGSDLLADFPAGDGGTLGAAVDHFLDQLSALGSPFAMTDEAPERASWPLVWTAALLGLEVGRRLVRRRQTDDTGSDNAPRARGSHDSLTGWPGSWSARVP